MVAQETEAAGTLVYRAPKQPGHHGDPQTNKQFKIETKSESETRISFLVNQSPERNNLQGLRVTQVVCHPPKLPPCFLKEGLSYLPSSSQLTRPASQSAPGVLTSASAASAGVSDLDHLCFYCG